MPKAPSFMPFRKSARMRSSSSGFGGRSNEPPIARRRMLPKGRRWATFVPAPRFPSLPKYESMSICPLPQFPVTTVVQPWVT